MTLAEQARLLRQNAQHMYPRGGLEKKLSQASQQRRQLIVKMGMDPTAPDIHLGHTVVLRKLRQFQDCGHKVVLIVGDFTATIGDPSGKSKTRPMLSDDQIKQNALTYYTQVTKVLDPDPKKLSMRLNSEWLGTSTAHDLIKLFAKVTASQILAREDFADRMKNNTPIGLHELLYPVLQGYDSVALESDLELGGSDQTFNVLMGRDIQLAFDQEPQVVMTMPLLVGLDGKQKMSKSLGNYIALTESADNIVGKIMSLPDNVMQDYARLTTDLDLKSFAAMAPMEAKKLLAQTIAGHYTSVKQAKTAVAHFETTFQKREFPAQAPHLAWTKTVTLLELLKEHDVLPSTSEARRKIAEGAIHVNGKKVVQPDYRIVLEPGQQLQLKVGKKLFYLVTRQK